MVMDQQLTGLYGSVSGLKLNDENLSVLSGQNLVNGLKLDDSFVNQNYANIPPLPPDLTLVPSNSVLSLAKSQDGDSHEDFDFSDVVLKYINEMLMEEEYRRENFSSSSSGSNLVDPGLNCDLHEYKSLRYASQSGSQSSHSSGNSTSAVVDGFADSPVSTISEMFSDSESIMQFKKGFKEASRFIPNGSLFTDLKSNGLFLKDLNEESKDLAVKAVEKQEIGHFPDDSRKRRILFQRI
ncbi:hypothetical protein GH714_010888 [Hevea brasiliensis]|uniref:Uncharacterized protein n=1 Tax=Hevea brasiliensis TaxID=3981 RepID=A0A6A6MZC0_HEVBR|nr:hypothetical protein GH714_010888 [Hevea brasiliensis]